MYLVITGAGTALANKGRKSGKRKITASRESLNRKYIKKEGK